MDLRSGVGLKRQPNRTCLARRCGNAVRRPDILCPSHWAMLPSEFGDALRRAIASGIREHVLALLNESQQLIADVGTCQRPRSSNGQEPV